MATTKNVASGTQATSIGTVKSVIGTVTATDTSGVTRTLQVGDKVFANEIIQTSDSGAILIEFVNGTHADLGRNSTLTLDLDVFNPNQVAAEQSDISAIQAQIAAGADPTQVTEASAAGAGAGDEGGSSFVVIDQLAAQGLVTSGFPTAGIAAAFPQSSGLLNDTPPPVAADDENNVIEDELIATDGNVLGNDASLSGGGLAVTGIPAGSSITLEGQYGTLIINSDGSYSYTLNNGSPTIQSLAEGQQVEDAFEYIANDGIKDSNVAVLTITITGTNDVPVATANTGSLSEEGISVSGNMITDDDGFGIDSDADANAAISVTDVSGGDQHGTLTFNADGSYTYTLDNNDPAVQALGVGQFMTEVYTYTLTDDQGANDAATLTITITGTNDDPVATANLNSISEDGSSVSGNMITDNDGFGVDHDVDSNAVLSVTNVSGGNAYGTLSFNADGSYTYHLNSGNSTVQALNDGQTLTEVYTYTLSDGAGGTDTATVTISIRGENEVVVTPPTAGSNAAAVDDDGLIGGNPASGTSGDATFAGMLAYESGGDIPVTISLAPMDGETATIGTESVTYHWEGDTLTATGSRGDLFTVQITNPATGDYLVTLLDNVLHESGGNENNASATLNYSVTDLDGTPAPGTLTITFNDDMPSASATERAVNEGTAVTGQLDFEPGADGATITHIDTTELVFNPDDSNYSQELDIGGGFLKVKANGEYSYRVEENTNATADSVQFTVTDGDGDTVEQSVTFNIVDANTPSAGTSDAAVDDDGLIGGNPASGTSGDATFTGKLAYESGGDIPVTISLAPMDGETATIGTESVTYHWEGDTLTATSSRGDLFTLQITNPATGDYLLTLLDNVQHELGGNENNGSATLNYSVTDLDGTPAPNPGTLTITFNDDMPSASATERAVNEGTTVTGLLDFEPGADGATITHIDTTELVFNPDDSNYSQELDIGGGFLKVKANGDYSYRVADNTDAIADSIQFTVTDSDGDTTEGSIAFNILDANTPSAGTSEAAVDDDGLSGGNSASGAGGEATFSGTLAYTSGGDIPVTISLAPMDGETATVGTETVAYSWTEDTLTATGSRGDLFTVQITNPATGAYKVILLDNVLHESGGNENNATATLNFSVIDNDGTPAPDLGTLTITFNDDMPSAPVIGNTFVYNEDGSLNTGTQSINFGADGAAATGSVLLQMQDSLPTGYTLLQDPTNSDVWRAVKGTTWSSSSDATDLFKVALNPENGTYTFQLLEGQPTTTLPIDIDQSLLTGTWYGANGAVTTDKNSVYSVIVDAGTDDIPFRITATALSMGNPAEISVGNDTLGVGGDDNLQAKFGDSLTLQFDNLAKLDTTLTQISMVLQHFNRDQENFDFTVTGTDSLGNTIHHYTKASATFAPGTDANSLLVTIDVSGFETVTQLQIRPTDGEFKIIDFDVKMEISQHVGDYSYNFLATATDGDDDSASSSFSVNVLAGTAGDDNLLTGIYDDTVSGGTGNDRLNGDGGNDQLNGGGGNDILVGGSGNDILVGGLGDDTMTGGDGHDTFVFNSDSYTTSGTDTIEDFMIGNLTSTTDGDTLKISDVLTAAHDAHPEFNIPTDILGAINGGFLTVQPTATATSVNIVLDLDGNTGSSASSIQIVTLHNIPVQDQAGLLTTLLNNQELT